MNRHLLSLLTAGIFYAALSTCMLVPAKGVTPSPPQGPPPPSPDAQAVLVNNLTGVLAYTIQPAIDIENATLANDPNFHAMITATLMPAAPSMTEIASVIRPNQLFADVLYSILYNVTNISALVGDAWVTWDGETATIGQQIYINASCEGWFTGRGTLTYSVSAQPASYEGTTDFPNPQTGVLLEQLIPNFVNTVINPNFAAFATGLEGELVNNGAACRTLGTAPPSVQPQGQNPGYIFFDPARNSPPVTTGQNTVTVKVTRIHRLEMHGADGLPVYKAVETPTLDFYAGFTHLQIKLPAMTEGQTFIPTSDNVATTLVPLESGTLVVLGVMSYEEDIPHIDPAFLTFSRNLDYGAGKQTLFTPKALSPNAASTGKAYEITLEVTAPPVTVGAQ